MSLQLGTTKNPAARLVVLIGAVVLAAILATVMVDRSRGSLPAAPATVRGFVGLVFRPVAAGRDYPAGVEHLGGGSIVDPGWAPGQPAPYLWEYVTHESRHMLWLERYVDSEGTAPRRVKVIDAIDAGDVPEGYTVAANGCGLMSPGGTVTQDPEVAAVAPGENEDEEEPGEKKEPPSPAALRAWRLDRAGERIEPLAATGIACLVE